MPFPATKKMKCGGALCEHLSSFNLPLLFRLPYPILTTRGASLLTEKTSAALLCAIYLSLSSMDILTSHPGPPGSYRWLWSRQASVVCLNCVGDTSWRGCPPRTLNFFASRLRHHFTGQCRQLGFCGSSLTVLWRPWNSILTETAFRTI